MTTDERFESWAVIDLFGHSKIAGRVTEATIGGCAFLRVDVPEIDGQAAFTKFYGNGAIYSMSPCSEELARLAVRRLHAQPISIYIPELHQLPAGTPVGNDYDGDDDEDLEDAEDERY